MSQSIPPIIKTAKNRSVKKKIKITEPSSVREDVAKPKKEEVEPDIKIELQLGDIIKTMDSKNELFNDQVFLIDYIDNAKIHLVNTEDGSSTTLLIQSNGVLGEGTIDQIILLSSPEYPGYAKQNDLLPGKWINIYFNQKTKGEKTVSMIITGEITDLEKDMIEIKSYPDNEIFYINFDYKGIPEDLSIEKVELRNPPEKPIVPLQEEEEGEKEEAEEAEEVEEAEREEISIKETVRYAPEMSQYNVKNKLQEIILDANQIIFGKEALGPITQYVDVSESRQRYSIDVQVNDLLDDLLSTVPNYQRTSSLLNEIHIMLERYKQLRTEFSSFDEYGNVTGKLKGKGENKPLLEYLQKFNQSLYWILPVVKNVKKVYNVIANRRDVIENDTITNLMSIEDIIENYRSGKYPEEQNKYELLIQNLNPYFTPFEELDPENTNDILIDKSVLANLNVVMNNLNDFESSIAADKKLSTRKFLMEKYNVGMTKLDTLSTHSVGGVTTSGLLLTKRIEITSPDVLSIQSILTLPEPVIRFSQINLPGTSILDRTQFNLHFLNYWELLNSSTSFKNVAIENLSQDLDGDLDKDFEKEMEVDEETFLQDITQYTFGEINTYGEPSREKNPGKKATREEIYQQWIQRIVPPTRTLFYMMRKYIQGKLSIVDLVQYLEPFLVYTKDITYRQYIRMSQFIYGKIREYNRRFVERSQALGSLRRNKKMEYRSTVVNIFLDLLSTQWTIDAEIEIGDSQQRSEKINLRKDVEDLYQFYANVNRNSLEFLRGIFLKDSGRFYFSALSLPLIDLMFPHDFSTLLDQDKKDVAEDMKKDNKGECENVVIVKMYLNEEDLLADNNREIYFDKKYDKTNYGILEKYEKEMMQMTTEDFIAFLIQELEKKERLTKGEAEYLADTLITGLKRVTEGQYAVIHQLKTEGEEEGQYQFIYYERVNHQWVKDEELTKTGIKSDSPNVLCNLQENCLANERTDQCESGEINQLQLKEKLLKNMLGEFDQKYELSKRQLKESLQKTFLYYQNTLPILLQMERNFLFKSNNQKYKIALKMEKEEEAQGGIRALSPYSKLLDIILGQQDFVKKQYDILRFQETYTREAYPNIGPLGQSESPYWFYCIETNVKIMPQFLFVLAATWVNNPELYQINMDLLIKEIGVLGDDGDSWVDKHSGYIIRKIDYSTEEGFDEGFRVSTRAVLEEDAEDKIRNALLKNGVGISDKERRLVQNTPEVRMINNVIQSLSTAMGISLETQKEWMIDNITTLLKNNIPKESEYKKQVQEMANKGRTIPSFKELYNTLLLYYTLGLMIIAIQTGIPSIRTRRTFPGCVKSFTGYPLEGAGDLSTINYLACIVYKIRSSSEPWSILKKKKETAIASTLKETIDKYLLGLFDVKRKMEEKVEYLLLNQGSGKEGEIEDEYNVQRWTQFLPPLVPFQIKQLQNVSPEFEKTLLQEMKSGSSLQREKIGILEGKRILFSLAIQEKINAIVQKKEVILRKMTNEPYLENACCNESSPLETSLQYFEKEDASIDQYNSIVKRLSGVFKDIHFYSSAPLLYSPFNTKNIYPPVDMKFSERTIYKAFIQFCHFQNLKPIPEDLVPLCVDKPDYLKPGDNLTEMMGKLKKDGRTFTYENFLRLLQMVNRNHIIPINVQKEAVSAVQQMRDVIEIIKDENTEEGEKEKELLALLESLLDTYDIETERSMQNEIRVLNNYLSKSITSMKNVISDFMTKNKGPEVTKKDLRKAVENVNTLSLWEIFTEGGENGAMKEMKGVKEKNIYRILEFYRNYTENFVQIFPSIIQNRLNYQNVSLPKYWGLSGFHSKDIQKMISDYYKELRVFYDVRSLTRVLTEISRKTKNLLLLSQKTPCFTSMKKEDGKEITPIFDERTSKMLLEYYILRVMKDYIDLTEENEMILVTALNPTQENVENRTYNENIMNEPIFTTDYVEEIQTNLDVMEDNGRIDATSSLFVGNKKELRQKTCDLLMVYLNILTEHKETIDVSYDKIQDRAFKLKQREKDDITDRLKNFTDEQRDVDTLLKINKLGDWSKGLQKGLTTYVKENYDDEREFMEKMMQYERDFSRKNQSGLPEGENFEDYLEQVGRDEEAERDAYDMSNMTEDYMDGYEPGAYEEDQDYSSTLSTLSTF